MSDLKLYEVADAIRRLMDEVAENGGEMTAEQEAFLASLGEMTAEKVEAICKIRREKLAAAFAIDDEIRRLGVRKRAEEAGADRLKDYLKTCLEKADETSVKTPLFSVRIQNSPPRALWTGDVDKIPDAFVRVVPATREFNAAAALKARRDGLEVPDQVEFVQGRHIVIK